MRRLLRDARQPGELRKKSPRATLRSGLSEEDAHRTERALRLVYTVLLPRMVRQSTPPQLGFGRPAMAQLCVRNWEFFVSLSQELDERIEDTIYDAELSAVSDWPRIERQHMEEAALDLLGAVQALPAPVRDVVVRRSQGWSWTAISAGLPGRAYFSLTDDWSVALRLLWQSHGDLVRRLI